MDWVIGVLLMVGFPAALFAGFAFMERRRREVGRADSVRAIVAVGGEPAAFWSIERLYFSGGDGDGREVGRITLRAAADGRLLGRVEAHAKLSVLARDSAGNLVCSDPDNVLSVRDARTLEILRDAASIETGVSGFLERFAPFGELRPEFDRGAFSVLDRVGNRVSLGQTLGELEPIDASHPGSFWTPGSIWSTTGHPRARVTRNGAPVGDADFLHASLLGSVGDDALVLSRIDLRSEQSQVSRMNQRGEVLFTTDLQRPASGGVSRLIAVGGRIVLCIDSEDPWPLELVALDGTTGEICWRLRP